MAASTRHKRTLASVCAYAATGVVWGGVSSQWREKSRGAVVFFFFVSFQKKKKKPNRIFALLFSLGNVSVVPRVVVKSGPPRTGNKKRIGKIALEGVPLSALSGRGTHVALCNLPGRWVVIFHSFFTKTSERPPFLSFPFLSLYLS